MTPQRAVFPRLSRLLLMLAAAVFSLSGTLFADPDRYVLITLLHTNDMHATVMPENGSTGLAKIATVAKRVRSEMPNVVFLDAGDIIHGTFEDYLAGGKAIISSMNAAGYEVATAGNHEFDFGLKTTQEATRTAVFPFLSSNVRSSTTGEVWNGFSPYIIKNVDGVRIAVFGLTTLQTVDFEWPARIAEVKFIDPYQAAAELVPELRKQADVIIALSHLGFPADQQLAKKVPGIDFIIGGHSHTILDKWTWIDNTMISHAGAMAAFLGRIDFIAKVGGSGTQIVSINGKNGETWSKLSRRPLDKSYPESPLIPMTAEIPDDPAVVEAYTPYRQKARAVLDEVIGETREGIASNVTDGDMPAGNLVADAVRWSMQSDISAIDPASVAGGIPPGRITVENAFRLIGGYTRQHLVKVEITGDALKEVLGVYLAKKKNPPLVISGMTVTYRLDQAGAPVLDQLYVGESPVDPARVYTAASQAYVIMDWQKVRPNIRVAADPETTTREAIVDFIRNTKTVEYKTENRVRRVE